MSTRENNLGKNEVLGDEPAESNAGVEPNAGVESNARKKSNAREIDLEEWVESRTFNTRKNKKKTEKKEDKPAPKTGTLRRKPSRAKTLLRSVGFILVAVQAATSILLMVSLISTNVISGQQIAVFAAVLIVLLLLSAVKLIPKRETSTATKVACGLISAVCIIVSIVAFRYTDAFNNFLNQITFQRPETKEYSVMVLKNSEVKELKELRNESVGFLKTDEKAGNAEQYLQEKVKIGASFYDDIDTLTSVLQNKISTAIVLESDRLNLLLEENLSSVQGTRVIYTFEIETESENAEIVQKEVTKEPFVVYISGTDSRAGVKATARSDVNIIAVVNPAKGKILLVSIPRDMYVQLHGTVGLRDKLTHAGVYGIEMSKSTIGDFLGVTIDYTVKVSFDTVVKVVDELDGVEIYSDTAMTLGVEGKSKKCTYTVGLQQVDGDCALRFARERKSYETGDRHRGENQQEVITAIINKLSTSRNYLLKVPSILDIAADSFETTFSRNSVTEFIRLQLDTGMKWEVESIQVDGAGAMEPTYTMGANWPLYVMIPNEATVTNATSKIKEYLVSE